MHINYALNRVDLTLNHLFSGILLFRKILATPRCRGAVAMGLARPSAEMGGAQAA